MVKSKKGKKGGKDVDTDSDSEVISKKNVNESEEADKSSAKDKKKSKKKKAAEDGDDIPEAGDDVQSIEQGDDKKENVKKPEKKKKKQKKGAADSDDDGDDVDALSFLPKKAGKSRFADLDDEENDQVREPSKAKKSTKSVFQLLDVEDADGDADERMDVSGDEDDDTARSSKKKAGKESKKKKKKKRKGDDDDDDEIDQLLAELELEYKGEKPVATPSAPSKAAAPPAAEKKVVATAIEAADGEGEAEEADEKKKKKKKKRKDKDEDEPSETRKHGADDDDEEEGRTMKSAAQKKKEKKERDRLKKIAEKADERAKEERRALNAKPEKKKEPEVEKEDEEPVVVEEDGEEDAGEKDGKNATGKTEKDKKRPGKRQLLLMQEALKLVKAEDERVRKEEEEKIRLEELAEEKRINKLKREAAKKVKAKIRDKERREKLKAEGKLLSRTQRLQKARVAVTVEAFKEQGFAVPTKGEKKVYRPGTRVRSNKLKPTKSNEEEGEVDAKVDVLSGDVAEPKTESSKEAAEQVATEKPVEVIVEDVKDAWDASSGSEDEEPGGVEEKKLPAKSVTATTAAKKVQIKIKEDSKKKVTAESTTDDDSSSGGSSDSESDSDSDSDSDDSSDSDSDSDDSESSSEESEEEKKSVATRTRERALERIRKRKEEAEKNRVTDNLRSPIVCVLGHVDTGKTKILDKIRHTNVQDGEAGGITQQIGATMVPMYAIQEQAKMVKNFSTQSLKVPGLLIIDTPGHESFSNLRSRGSSLCDIAILVVDIMHGIEPQTLESINLLKARKTPFIVALNKIDRLYDWKVTRNKDFRDIIRTQTRNTQLEFEQRTKEVILQFSEQGLNAALFYENTDVRTYVSLVPTSATTGEGMGNLLALVVDLTQTMLSKRLAFSEDLQATVLELKALPGLGTTIDVILVNGRLHEGDTIVLAGMDGPVVTQIRSLLMPQPLKELRVKNPYEEFKEVQAAQGIKITAKDLEKVVAGLNLVVAVHPDEVEVLKEEVTREFHSVMSSIKLSERGVYVQASTLGSLEALLEFLRTSKIPYAGIRIGPVVKRDVMKASIMLEHDGQFAVILAFDVKIERDAQELADNLGVRIFAAPIIYHLFDHFTAHREQLRVQKRDEVKHLAVFPCKLRILPQFIFNSRDPIVLGVSVEAGVVKEGTPICVPSQEFLDIGIVTTIEINHKTVETAKKGQEVCIKIESIPGDSPKMFGRHFEATDMLVSKISRQSIDVCKNHFRDDLSKTDWQLMIELKKLFEIL